MMDEKILAGPEPMAAARRSNPVQDGLRGAAKRSMWIPVFLAAALVVAWTHSSIGVLVQLVPSALQHCRPSSSDFRKPHRGEPQCRQVDPLQPNATSPQLEAMEAYFSSPDFLDLSVARLSGAVRIRTPTFDDMGDVDEDPRWDAFDPLAEYLKQTFPRVHAALSLEKVNKYGLLYTWPGSETPDELKPTLLLAHQDVVPVDEATIEEWEHDPWGGEFDGKAVWGRGSLDCKNNLVGILSAVEALLEADFAPRRTVLLSFGFDEEVSGVRGASNLSAAVLERYGEGGVAVIVDEGASVVESWGTNFAAPGVAEKGYTDVEVVVRMPGGHSSVPPPHNGIGVMAELITAIEANPYAPRLHTENPFLDLLHCADEHAADFPDELSKLLRKHDREDRRREADGWSSSGSSTGGKHKKRPDKLAEAVAEYGGDAIKYLFTTSAAADIISGGVKANALPERTVLTVNHRVNVGESPSDVWAKLKSIAGGVADRHNLTLHVFDRPGTSEDADEPPSSITLRTNRDPLEPAPVSPTSVDGTTPYSVLSGTTRALYGESLVVAPALMTGNTDTRYYWDLTKHIFRYGPQWHEGAKDMMQQGIHTVNEHADILSHVNGVKWYSLFLRNMDEADLE